MRYKRDEGTNREAIKNEELRMEGIIKRNTIETHREEMKLKMTGDNVF